MMQQQRPSGFTPTGHFETWAEISLDNLGHNIRVLRELLGKTELMAVLKANAYSLYAPAIFSYLRETGVRYFAVANIREALQLRELDPDAFIMILGNVHPRFMQTAIENKITLSVFSREFWQLLKEHLSAPLSVHIKLNTGFNRLGFSHTREDMDTIKEICSHPLIKCGGIFSHLALGSAEDDLAQFENYKSMVSALEEEGLKFPLKHLAGSDAAVAYPWARLNLVRAGSVMFGHKTSFPGYAKLDLKGVLSFRASVSQVRDLSKGMGVSYDFAFRADRDMRIATLSFGYGDGYPRTLGLGKSFVIIRGQKAPIIGNICMDQCVADVSHIPGVRMNDEVIVYETDSSSAVSESVIARLAGFSESSVFASLAPRIPRIFIKDGKRLAINPLSGKTEEIKE